VWEHQGRGFLYEPENCSVRTPAVVQLVLQITTSMTKGLRHVPAALSLPCGPRENRSYPLEEVLSALCLRFGYSFTTNTR